MLRTIEMYTNKYKDTTQKEIRKKKGQFFTPAEVSMRMAAVENKYPKNQLIRVLDPGAGNGILSFAVIDKLLRSGYKRLDITLIETDKEILPVLEYTITKIRQICESYHAECFIHYVDQNFILWESSYLYDIVICNPPYMKVRKDSVEATAMKTYVYGQPNLYGLFMAKAIELLCDNGQYIFIGSTRGVMRDCVYWAAEAGVPLHVWGSGWYEMMPEHKDVVDGTFMPNDKLPALYRSAKVTLNDHWKDMLDNQIINNRIFDALACGLPVISDGCDEMKEIFPDAVLYYDTKEEFDACIKKVENDYEAVKAKALEQYDMIKKEYSFERRVEELLEIAEKYKK